MQLKVLHAGRTAVIVCMRESLREHWSLYGLSMSIGRRCKKIIGSRFYWRVLSQNRN